MGKNKDLKIEKRKMEWIDALHRKLEMRTQEEWDFETMSETIYKDDVLEFYRECQEDYVLVNVENEHYGLEAWLDYFLGDEVDLGEIINVDSLRGVTFMDYMEEKGFPITFKTWPDGQNRERRCDYGKR